VSEANAVSVIFCLCIEQTDVTRDRKDVFDKISTTRSPAFQRDMPRDFSDGHLVLDQSQQALKGNQPIRTRH